MTGDDDADIKREDPIESADPAGQRAHPRYRRTLPRERDIARKDDAGIGHVDHSITTRVCWPDRDELHRASANGECTAFIDRLVRRPDLDVGEVERREHELNKRLIDVPKPVRLQ